VEAIGSALGWLAFLTALIAVLTVGCLLASLVEIAAAAGGYAGRPIPAGVQRRASRVEARVRARYRPRSASVPWAANAGLAPDTWTGAGGEPLGAETTPLAA
jgi:hypothetical protein